MSDQKEQRRPIIEYAVAKPFVDAGVLSLGCASTALIPSIASPAGKAAAVGFGFSCFWYWGSGNLKRSKPTQTTRKKGHTKLINGKPFTFDQVAPGQFVTRQSAIKDFLGFLGIGNRKPAQRPAQRIDKPAWMKEQVFHSHCNGYPVQLMEPDVTRFLLWAYRHRQRGEGLSERSWDRFGESRGAWYQELPRPQWCKAMMNLLYAAQKLGGKQLIIEIGNQKKLAREPAEILEALRWLEDQRNAS